MTQLEKCKMAIDKGYVYNPETGQVFGPKGEEIKGKTTHGYIRIKLHKNNQRYNLRVHNFGWYCIHNEVVDYVYHINKIKNDNRIINLSSITRKEYSNLNK